MTPRLRNWLLIFIVLILVALSGRLQSPPPVARDYFAVAGPMVIAHQGGDGIRPGNTLLAFRHAAELGVDVLEMDVHLTRDGHLVLMHDASVERTTDGQGALVEMTLAEVKALDAAYRWPYDGERHPYRGRGVHVPTLEETVGGFPELRYNVEIKPDSAAAGEALCNALTRLGATRRTLVASFHADALAGFRKTCPQVPTSAHGAEVRWFYLRYRTGLWRLPHRHPQALQLPTDRDGYDFTQSDLLAVAARQDVHVDYWTVNDAPTMRDLIARGADGLITDRPDLLLEVLGRR